MFSFYSGNGIKNTKPSDNAMTLERLYKLVRSDKYDAQIKPIRALQKKEDKENVSYRNERNALKNYLDYITPAGTFTARNEKSLIQRSGIFCLDFDHVIDLRLLKAGLISKLNPALFFDSPSGDGIKVFYFIDVNAGSHLDYFNAFTDYFAAEMKTSIDPQCKDVSRACFMSQDCNSYYSENSVELGQAFLEKWLPKEKPINNTPPPTKNNTQSDFDKCEVIRTNLDGKETFMSGNRNHYVGLLSAGLNRIGIAQNVAYNYLLNFEQEDFAAEEIRKIVECSYKQTDKHNCNPLKDKPNNAKEPVNQSLKMSNDFPIDGLPKTILNLAQDTSTVYGVPIEMSVMPMIAAIGTAMGKNFYVDSDKFKNYGQLYLVINTPSGVGKSAPLKIAYKPLTNIDRANFEQYIKDTAKHKEICAANKKMKPQPADPPAPIFLQNLVSDTTPEALVDVLSNNNNTITIFCEELSEWFLNFGRYSGSSEAQAYLSYFDNTDKMINRKLEKKLITDPYVSVVGSIQPAILETTINSEAMKANGLASRFLFVNCLNVERAYKNDLIPNVNYQNNYQFFINKLSEFHVPQRLVLSAEAKELFRNFGDYLTDTIRGSKNAFFNSSLSKMEIQCLRLALIIETVKNAEVDRFSYVETYEIGIDTMQYAINLCHYFIGNIPIPSNGELVKLENKTLQVLEMLKNGRLQKDIASELKVSQQYISTIKKKYKLTT